MIENKTIEHVLDNGLKVLCLNTHGLPVVTFMTWYKVGSRNEQDGKTGLSHFLEHLSFKSTEMFETGQIAAEITRNGGNFNAYTSRDFTCYFETFATSKLELAMIIESQRMNKLRFDQNEIDKEVGIILSEMEKNLDNPYSSLDLGLRSEVYKNHPYKNPVIGWADDVEAITMDDLQQHYENYYTPNNATIVIVGNFNYKTALELVNKYFGSIPAREIPGIVAQEAPQQTYRQANVRKCGSVPLIKHAYHIPNASHNDIYPLAVLGEMLNMGISSRLYKPFIEGELALDINVNVEISKDPGLFTINSTLYPSTTHEQAEELLFKEISGLNNSKAPTKEELEQTKQRIISSFEFNKDGTYKYAYLLGYYETICSHNHIDNYIENIKKVDIEDIKRVAGNYLIENNCSSGRLIPSHHETKKLVPEYDYIPTNGTHHIYKDPPIIITESIESAPIQFNKKVLLNGITVLHTQNKSNDTIKLTGNIKAGNIYSSMVNPVLPVMCAGMLNRGSDGKTKQQIAVDVESKGATVGVNNVGESVSFSLSSTVNDFNAMLKILAGILIRPDFPKDEFEKYKHSAIAGLKQKRTYASVLSEIAFNQMIFPKGHLLYSYGLKAQEYQLNRLTLDEVKEFYHTHYSPETMIISLSGNIGSDKAFGLIEEYFKDFKKIEYQEPLVKTAQLQSEYKEKTVRLRDKKEASVVFGHYFPVTRSSDDYHKATVMNFILGGGGALSSRIGLKIREDLGLVYSISSCFHSFSMPGAWSARFGVDSHYADMAIDALKTEIENFVNKGITDQELDLAKSYLIGSYPLRFNNNTGIARALLINEFYRLGDNYLNEYPAVISAITREDVNGIAEKYLHPDRASVVKVGDF